MQQFAVGRNRLRPRDLVRAIDIVLVDLVTAHGDDALARHGLYVLAGDTSVQLLHLRAGHALGVL